MSQVNLQWFQQTTHHLSRLKPLLCHVNMFLGLGKLAQAEDYLSQAQWTVMKNADCPNTIRHRLCRNLGLLYVAKGDYERALMELADDVRFINHCCNFF